MPEKMQMQATSVDEAADALSALLEQVTALNKNFSLVYEDINQWKRQEQEYTAQEEEKFDARDSFPA